MSDREVERGKFYGRKKYNTQRNDRDQKPFGRKSLFKTDKDTKADEADAKNKAKHPQILIKTREKVDDHSMSPKHAKEKEDVSHVSTSKETLTTTDSNVQLAQNAKQMHKAVKLLDDGILYYDSLQDYVNETSDFLVVGIIGTQGVGKSTIMNLLATEKFHNQLKKCGDDDTNPGYKHTVFKLETAGNYENCSHTTNGIDMYITENRKILLDCQPFQSTSAMDDLAHSELKRSNMLATTEHFGELQGLQHIAFLMSVCHVLIFTQDCCLDPNSVRFLLTAEMLKPTLTNNEEEFLEQFPHLLILQTKSPLEYFTQARFNQIQQAYRTMFKGSKMSLESNMGMGTGKIIPGLNEGNCGPPINLFLLPDFDCYEDSVYNGYPPLEQLAKTLKRNINCVTKFPLSHVTLTEKTWLSYCTKVWDHVKKSPFYVEYAKVLP